MVPHPIIVDFAIALLAVSVAFDVLASVVEERDLTVVAWWTLLFGTVAAVLATISGLISARSAAAAPRIVETIVLHRAFGIATMVCFAVCALWRAGLQGSFPERLQNLYWGLAVFGLGLLVVTGYFGGILVFRLGVGVILEP